MKIGQIYDKIVWVIPLRFKRFPFFLVLAVHKSGREARANEVQEAKSHWAVHQWLFVMIFLFRAYLASFRSLLLIFRGSRFRG